MIQDIQPYEFCNQYTNSLPEAKSYLMVVRQHSVLVKTENRTIDIPRWKEFPTGNCTYLFSINDARFFLAGEDEACEAFAARMIQEGYSFQSTNALRYSGPVWLRFAAATSVQLGSWYQANRFCGSCGGSMERDDQERMLRCRNCGNMVYPKICPAVIVGVVYRDSLLVTKYAAGIYKKYALVAGYTEIGETAEETVRREVLEETGLHVKNIRYYKSQPWAFSDTLLLGFFCEVDGEPEIVLDYNELSEARWMEQSELPSEPDGVSLTNEMMVLFQKKGRGVLLPETC